MADHIRNFDSVDQALPGLLALLRDAPIIDSRAGRTREVRHVAISLHKPWQREILLSHRNPNLAAQVFETMWVLAGRDDMESLVRYLPRAAEFSDDGKRWRAGYGRRLRAWGPHDCPIEHDGVDQLRYVVEKLQADPNTRQAVMSIWDPTVDTTPGKDIPCNNWLSFSMRDGKLDLDVAIRSNDVIWGWSGINQFEWSALLEIVAGFVGAEVGALHFYVTSFHIYERHWDKANRIVTQAARDGKLTINDSPRFKPGLTFDAFDQLCAQWFRVEEIIRKDPLSEHTEAMIDVFPEPMLRSWLRVIQWWWSGDESCLLGQDRPELSRLAWAAINCSVQPKKPESTEVENVDLLADDRVVATVSYVPSWASLFARTVVNLHNEKDRAYGGSWKRRGEMLGIMANIARKIDRLGGSETADETSADTAIDLFVYLAKYRAWLESPEAEGTAGANSVMTEVDYVWQREHDWSWDRADRADLEGQLKVLFDELEASVVNKRADKASRVDVMVRLAYLLARLLWEQEESLKQTVSAPQPEAAGLAPTAEGESIRQRNARRSWNPEQHQCVHRDSTATHVCACKATEDHPMGEINQ